MEQKDSVKCLVLNENLKIRQIQDLMLESLAEFWDHIWRIDNFLSNLNPTWNSYSQFCIPDWMQLTALVLYTISLLASEENYILRKNTVRLQLIFYTKYRRSLWKNNLNKKPSQLYLHFFWMQIYSSQLWRTLLKSKFVLSFLSHNVADIMMSEYWWLSVMLECLTVLVWIIFNLVSSHRRPA